MFIAEDCMELEKNSKMKIMPIGRLLL